MGRFFQNISAHWIVACTGGASRIISVIFRFFQVLILLDYLGIENYAISAVILSFEGWFLLCDGGIGASAQNYLSEAKALGRPIDSLLKSIMQISLVVFSCFFIFFLSSFDFLAECVFGSKCTIVHKKAILFSGIYYLFQAIGMISYRVFYAFDKGYLPSTMQAFGSMVSCLLIWLFSSWDFGVNKLILANSIIIGIPAVIAMISFFYVFPVKQLFSSIDLGDVQRLLTKAVRFTGFAIFAIFVLGVDYMIMVKKVPPEDIAIYNIVNKMFMGFFVVHGAFMQAVWPVCSEMAYQKRYNELKTHILKYCIGGVLYIGCITVFLIVFSDRIVDKILMGKSIEIPAGMILLLGLYYLVRALCDPYAIVLQSMNDLKPLLITVPLQGLIGYFAQTYFVSVYGINGIVIGLICSFLATVSWILPFTFYKKMNRALC